MNTKVSIVVPVYNSEKTVAKCLESLNKQTYKNIEIICVNDFSKDASLKILESFSERDSRIKIINHTENKNAGGARNSGIRASTGDYICFVDNDDWIDERAIEILIENSDNSSVDIVSPCRFNYFSDTNKPLQANLPINENIDVLKKYGLTHGFSMLGCLIKRSLFVDNEIYFPEKIFYEDNPIAITILLIAQSIKSIAAPIYYYYHSSSSVTGFTNTKKISDRVKTTDFMISLLNEKGLYKDDFKPYIDLMFIKLSCYTYVLLSKIALNEAKPIFNDVCMKVTSLLPNPYVNKLSLRNRCFIRFPRITFHLARVYWNVIKVRQKV